MPLLLVLLVSGGSYCLFIDDLVNMTSLSDPMFSPCFLKLSAFPVCFQANPEQKRSTPGIRALCVRMLCRPGVVRPDAVQSRRLCVQVFVRLDAVQSRCLCVQVFVRPDAVRPYAVPSTPSHAYHIPCHTLPIHVKGAHRSVVEATRPAPAPSSRKNLLRICFFPYESPHSKPIYSTIEK